MTTPSLPPPPDSSLVEDALLALLLNDADLKALCPDGVWWDAGNDKSKRFVVVSLVDHQDVPVFSARGWEGYLFLVKAVFLNSAGGSVKQAAFRIDQLLENAQIDVDDFGMLSAYRERRIRYTERDPDNSAIRWLHRGGHYRIFASIGEASSGESWVQQGWMS